MLSGGCANPLRGTGPLGGDTAGVGGATGIGSGGSAAASGWAGSGGAGGSKPTTISIDGRSATGGASTGGAISTGGSHATSTTECTAGRCPVTLASGREQIWPGIALDGANVYWTEHSSVVPMFGFDGNGSVMKVPMEGGTATVLVSAQDFPSYIRADASGVYWTVWNAGNRGEMAMVGYVAVRRAPLDGGNPTTAAYLDLVNEPRIYGDFFLDGTSLYWAYLGRWDLDYVDGAILKVSLVDGSTTTLASGQWCPNQIAVDSSSVYWVNGTNQNDDETSLMKMPLAGGVVTTLNVSPSGHRAVVLDASHIYWTSSDGTVMRMPREGGAPSTMASGQPDPVYIAVDGTSVYWANREVGTIMKLSLAGGTPATLVVGQSGLQALAVDATSVYWTTLGTRENDYRDGTVMKLIPK
jgi:hypothetical protein